MKIAIEESKKENVRDVYMDKSLKVITNGEVNSSKRPDVTVELEDGRLITHGIKSKSKKVSQLQEKLKKRKIYCQNVREDQEMLVEFLMLRGESYESLCNK